MIGSNKDDWAYLWYIIRHKFFVLRAGLVLHVSLWRLLVHDLSKFRSDEWIPYRHYFYKKNRDGKTHAELKECDPLFKHAWTLHIRRNDHHWQHWFAMPSQPLQMPECAVREMVADWIGTGRAINGRYTFLDWWEENEPAIKLHPATYWRVTDLMLDFEEFMINHDIPFKGK